MVTMDDEDPACPPRPCGGCILDAEEYILEKSVFHHPLLDSHPRSSLILWNCIQLDFRFTIFRVPPATGRAVNVSDVDAPYLLALCMCLLLQKNVAIGRRLLRFVKYMSAPRPTRPGGVSATNLMPSQAFLKSIYMSEGANAFHTVCIPRAPPIVQCVVSIMTYVPCFLGVPRCPWMTIMTSMAPHTSYRRSHLLRVLEAEPGSF